MWICPQCGASLELGGATAVCACGREFRKLHSGGWSFLPDGGFPDFQLDPDDAGQQDLLEQEAVGVAWRTEGFLFPMIRRYSRAAAKKAGALSVLDCGCGSGLSVDILRAHGMAAVGIDAGQARQAQWATRSYGPFLHAANALELPFADGSFDVVVSSGLVEHIGIHEEEALQYRAQRLPDCESQRRRFVRELVRVLKPDGFILLDHPNGAFPADFWHGGKAGSIRWHAPRGDMLPRFREVAHYFKAADPSLRLYSLSPRNRLRFRQVRNHWYGVLLAPAMGMWLGFLSVRWLSFLTRSFLNPYLVTLACRVPRAANWIHQ